MINKEKFNVTNGNHFPDLGKMVCYDLLADFTSDLSCFNYFMEVVPFRIIKNALQFSCKPVFVSVFVNVANIVK